MLCRRGGPCCLKIDSGTSKVEASHCIVGDLPPRQLQTQLPVSPLCSFFLSLAQVCFLFSPPQTTLSLAELKDGFLLPLFLSFQYLFHYPMQSLYVISSPQDRCHSLV
eukprot:GGOE01027240.1.p2 GENE.GGOE01027240.1~~GGOE01027240.1.p2  ORF type:complete len:108 (-),score=2.73 GGOE01027240.1:478-801(-)